MASTTPNIGLTLPTGGERVSRQIINDNNTIIDGKMGAVPGGQNLQGEIDALNSKLYPATYTSPTMTANVTLVTGGYVRIGKIVIVSMRVTTSASVTDICSNLPLPLTGAGVADNQGVLEMAVNSPTSCYLEKQGHIVFVSSVNAGTYIISGVYISAN